ncbi:MAG: hypothetical protein LBR97_06720 [Dysgonamonadaceae bacterium]|jgi:hypothetical protein|nr:hypothetical protein [Dysgonamonadaceae bacterium]
MNMTKRTIFLLLLFLMVLGAVNVNAQVRIGGSTAPHESVILDLNPDSVQKADKGLVLPRVNLESLTLPKPLSAFISGAMVYNLTTTTGGELNEGVYYSNGVRWFPVISDSSVNAGTDPPIIFLRQSGFLWLGSEGEFTDTLCFELADVDKSQFTYQWYTRDPVTLVSTRLEGDAAKNDTLFITKDEYGITTAGKVYQFYCVVVRGSQYGISGTVRVVYGSGAWLAGGKWINVAPANLGAKQGMTLKEQIKYSPISGSAGNVNYDPTVYGDWYQWGREKDGHEERDKASSEIYDGHITAFNGVGVDSLNTNNGQIKSDFVGSIYGKFIQRNASGSSTNDWRQYPETADSSAVSPANDWTWGNPVKGITNLDPCSELNSGDTIWRVPTAAEWAQIQSNNTWVWNEGNTKGYEIKPGGDNKPTSLFLPATGTRNRNGGVQINVGIGGYYWSSTVTSTSSYALGFSRRSITAASPYSRSNGLTVRCVSEY